MCETFKPNGRRATVQGTVGKWVPGDAIMFAFCGCGQTFGAHPADVQRAYLITQGIQPKPHNPDACYCSGCNPYDRSP